jgi:hypothetical protein
MIHRADLGCGLLFNVNGAVVKTPIVIAYKSVAVPYGCKAAASHLNACVSTPFCGALQLETSGV